MSMKAQLAALASTCFGMAGDTVSAVTLLRVSGDYDPATNTGSSDPVQVGTGEGWFPLKSSVLPLYEKMGYVIQPNDTPLFLRAMTTSPLQGDMVQMPGEPSRNIAFVDDAIHAGGFWMAVVR